jgi:hypothetical protein
MRANPLTGYLRGAAVVVAIAIGAGACSGGGGTDATTVKLEPASTAGADPFTTEIAYTPVPRSTAPAAPVPSASAAPGPVRRVSGVAPGLYGGTQDKGSCDVEQMISFLGDRANAAKAKAWADAEGIAVAAIPSYLRSLTPVILRVDTRVTNHGFKQGKANALQSVLQAGTAVLVDQTGVPRAKCACGNPLVPAVQPQASATYAGTQWSGFEPSAVTVVTAGKPVDSFTLVDTQTGETFTRPVGGTGSTDESASSARGEDQVYTGTGFGYINVASDVPFVISSTHTLTLNLSYFVQQGQSILQKEGKYDGLQIRAGDGQSWRIVVRPLGPKLQSYTGSGDTQLGSPRLPAEVVVDLRSTSANPSPGDFYLASKAGVMASFSAVSAKNLTGIHVNDHTGNGFRLDLWGLPSECHVANATEQSVRCSSDTAG